MPYPVGNPYINQKKSDSQTPMLQMNQTIGTVFKVDHVDFDNGGDEGKHKQLRIPGHNQGYTVSNGNIVLYTNTNPPADFTAGTPSLILRKTGGKEIPLTRRRKNSGDSFFYLPCGILVKTQLIVVDNRQEGQLWTFGSGVTINRAFSDNCPPFLTTPVIYYAIPVGPNVGIDPNVDVSANTTTNATTLSFNISRRTARDEVAGPIVVVKFVAFGVI